MKYRKPLAALLCAVSSFAHAETSGSLDEVVVTATRISQPLNQSLAHSSVITRHEIEVSQSADVAALLKNLAGVEIYQTGGIGKQSSLFMRGTNSSHVLVLLDGVRIGSATSGLTAFDQLMLDQIERIEVVRGNVSSLYGSEAIGGVIQIFSRQGKGAPSFNVGASVGSHDTQRASAGFGGEAGNATFNVQLSKYKTGGVSAINSRLVPMVNQDRDGYDNTSISANLRYRFNPGHNLALSLFDSRADSQTDNSFGATNDANESWANVGKVALISDNRFSDSWQSRLQLSQGLDDTQNFLNGAPDVILGARFKTVSDQLSWQNTLQLGSGMLNLGLDSLEQRVSSDTSFTRTQRTSNSLFAGYTGLYGAHQVQLNLRRDHYSDFGDADTALLGYGYDLDDVWRITASTGTAFKAPTLNDLFYPFVDFGFGFSYMGNPELKPERSRNHEIGLHYAGRGQHANLVYFDNRITDLIANNNLPASTMVNLGEVRINGLELAYEGSFGEAGVKAALTLQNPRDLQTGLALLRRAKSFASLGVTQRLGSWEIGGEWQHSGAREDIDINTFARTTLAGYNLVNLTFRHKLDKALTFSLRTENLFGKDYMLAHGYNTAGRTLFAGLDYRPQ